MNKTFFIIMFLTGTIILPIILMLFKITDELVAFFMIGWCIGLFSMSILTILEKLDKENNE